MFTDDSGKCCCQAGNVEVSDNVASASAAIGHPASAVSIPAVQPQHRESG